MTTAVESPAAPLPLDRSPEARHALRVATATALCFLLAEWWQLGHANLAVWTTYMVMAQYSFTIFQKGIERIIGRFMGIVAGWALIAVLPDARFVRMGVEAILLTAFFYLYFADWLAYTFLNAGIFVAAIVGLGNHDPVLAHTSGNEMLVAVVVGVMVADVVSWLADAEHDLHIQPGRGGALFPVRLDWLNHSLMLSVSTLLVLTITSWLNLPTDKAIISVFFLAITPDVQSALHKGNLRLLGALAAAAWSMATFLLVGRVPHLLVLMGMLFFGMLLAGYVTRVGGTYAYVGLQMGLVLPLLIVVPPDEFGDLTAIGQRIEGIFAALASTVFVGSLWPFSLAAKG